MHSHVNSMTGKMFTASRDTKIAMPMLIGIALCPAYVSHGKMAALTRTQLLEKGSSKSCCGCLNSYLDEDLLFVGTMRFMDVTTMGIIELLAQFDPFIADHVSRYCSAGRGMFLIFHPQSAMNLLS